MIRETKRKGTAGHPFARPFVRGADDADWKLAVDCVVSVLVVDSFDATSAGRRFEDWVFEGMSTGRDSRAVKPEARGDGSRGLLPLC